MPNIPEVPDLAIEAGRHLCEELLEPLQERFGRISIRSGYRSRSLNKKGNAQGHGCAANEASYAAHIWDHRDAAGRLGATACIVVNSFLPYYEETSHWEALAWWVHDHLPHNNGLQFFPKLAAFNIAWRQDPVRSIYSYVPPRKRYLTQPGMAGYDGSHEAEYRGFLSRLA